MAFRWIDRSRRPTRPRWSVPLLLVVLTLALPRLVAAQPADALVTVVSLDEHGQPQRLGLGVSLGSTGQVLTSRDLFQGIDGQRILVKARQGVWQHVQKIEHDPPFYKYSWLTTAGLDAPQVPRSAALRLSCPQQVLVGVLGQGGPALIPATLRGVQVLSPRLQFLQIEFQEKAPVLAGAPVFASTGALIGMFHGLPNKSGSGRTGIFLAIPSYLRPPAAQVSSPDQGLRQEWAPESGSAPQSAFWEGVAASLQQDWPESRRQFDLALNQTPHLPEAWYGRGMAYYQLNDFSAAVADWQQAVRLLPDFAQSYYWLGKAWEKLGDMAAAQAAYQQAVGLAPGLQAGYLSLGRLAVVSGDLSQAREYYERADTNNPEAGQYWYDWGVRAQQQRRFPEALTAFHKVAALDHRNYPARFQGGRLALVLGKPQEAITLLGQAVQLQPREPQGRYYLALAYLSAWDRQRAWEHYFILQDLAPAAAARLATILKTAP